MCELTLTLMVVLLALVYFYVKYLYSYWQRRGIPYLKPSFPFGNFSKTFMQKKPSAAQFADLYRSTTEPFIGVFVLQNPLLLIRDPKLIRSILITDFQHFTDRDFYLNEKDEPLTAHLYALRGQNWRDMRARLTPAFTPNKMKIIFPTLIECGKHLQKHLSKVVKENQAIEMSEIFACFASNMIASTAFGIDIDCLADPDHPFRSIERQTFEINLKNGLRFIGWFFLQKILNWSRLRFVDRDVESYFLNLVAQTLKMREQKNIVRNDFFQLLVELRNNVGDTAEHSKTTLSFEQIAAEAFIFFLIGIRATALTSANCFFEIAKHPDIQQKIHDEIDHVMDQHNGQLTYEAFNELKYMECCIDETIRKYQLFDLTRICVKDYEIPGTDVIIEKGTSIIIPTFALNHDEQFFPDPETFDPTRFDSENQANKNLIDMPFLGFGAGPRNCVGPKMAKMLVKIGICSILQQYYVGLDDRHIGKELKFSVNPHPIGGIHLNLKSKQ